MSMRNYGVETKGMAFELTDFQRLMNSNVKGIIDNGVLEKMGIGEIETTIVDSNGNVKKSNDLDLIDLLDFTDIIDFTYEIEFATFIGEFEGYLEVDKTQERKYFNGDDIIILELKKYHSLYEKYENRDEIIAELKETLSKVGIEVDEEYIEEHYGFITGGYYA